jgi:hypothetical protein
MIATLLAGVSVGAFVLRNSEPPVSPPPNWPAERFLHSSKTSGANSQEATPAEVDQNSRPDRSSSAADLPDVRSFWGESDAKRLEDIELALQRLEAELQNLEDPPLSMLPAPAKASSPPSSPSFVPTLSPRPDYPQLPD